MVPKDYSTDSKSQAADVSVLREDTDDIVMIQEDENNNLNIVTNPP